MGKKQKKGDKGQNTVSSIHASFKANLHNLMTFVKNVTPIAAQHDKSMIEKLTLLFDKLSKVIGLSSEEIMHRIADKAGSREPRAKEATKRTVAVPG